MSYENATQFLLDIVHKEELRKKFKSVTNPQEFMVICQQLGYDFTHEELEIVIKEHSVGVNLRRETGIWTWLRTIKWI